jgi:hypothetical protein
MDFLRKVTKVIRTVTEVVVATVALCLAVIQLREVFA